MNKKLREDCRRVLSYFREENGVVIENCVAMEELAELIKEVSKANRGKLRKAHMIEEMADVKITMVGLQDRYHISDEMINKAIRKKIKKYDDLEYEKRVSAETENQVQAEDLQYSK